ncbi:MAG: DUF4384 domain-containing protein [Pseudomonadota bacterium]
MGKPILNLLTALVLLIGLNPLTVSPALGTASGKFPDAAASLLSVGKPGSDPIRLKAWTNIPKDRPANVGERIVIHFTADRDCYVVVANVSSKGSVTIVFPNRERPDNRVEGGKEYTLFGEESRLKLVFGTGISGADLLFFASSQPIDLSPFKISGNSMAVFIPASSGEDFRILKSKIEHASKAEGFNRAVLSIKSKPEGKSGLRLMGPRPVKGVKPGRAGDNLGDVTGTRGRKEDGIDTER